MTLSPTYRRGSLGVLSATTRMSSLVIQHAISATMDLEVSTDNDCTSLQPIRQRRVD